MSVFIENEALALLICHRCEDEATGTRQLVKLHRKCLRLSRLTGTCRTLGPLEKDFPTFLVWVSLVPFSKRSARRGKRGRDEGQSCEENIDPAKTKKLKNKSTVKGVVFLTREAVVMQWMPVGLKCTFVLCFTLSYLAIVSSSKSTS